MVEHIVDDEDKSLDPSRNEIVTIVYAGGLHLDRLSSIEILAKYVENLSSSFVSRYSVAIQQTAKCVKE